MILEIQERNIREWKKFIDQEKARLSEEKYTKQKIQSDLKKQIIEKRMREFGKEKLNPVDLEWHR